MTRVLGFLADWLGVKVLKIIIVGAYYIFIMAFYAFMLTAITDFYNLVHSLIDYFSTASSSSDIDLSRFFGLLDCVGFIDSLLSSMPAIISSLVFLFSRILWSVARRVKKDILDMANYIL